MQGEVRNAPKLIPQKIARGFLRRYSPRGHDHDEIEYLCAIFAFGTPKDPTAPLNELPRIPRTRYQIGGSACRHVDPLVQASNGYQRLRLTALKPPQNFTPLPSVLVRREGRNANAPLVKSLRHSKALLNFRDLANEIVSLLLAVASFDMTAEGRVWMLRFAAVANLIMIAALFRLRIVMQRLLTRIQSYDQRPSIGLNYFIVTCFAGLLALAAVGSFCASQNPELWLTKESRIPEPRAR